MRTNVNKLLRNKIFFLLGGIASVMFAQKNYQSATIAFYNVENLFDTIRSAGYINGTLKYDNPKFHISIPIEDTAMYEHEPFKKRFVEKNWMGKKVIRDLILIDEFTPEGDKVWNSEKYNQKLNNLTKAITNIGRDITKQPPVIIGLAEVENENVVNDLINHPTLKPYNYGMVHFNSLDKRGIDCALIYQKNRFNVTKAKPYILKVYKDDGFRDYTRDILRVSGELDGEEVHVLINHWPSRRGGEKASNPKRVAAGKLLKSIFEEIQTENPNAKIIALGDFNDDPVNESIKKELNTVTKKNKATQESLYNPMEALYKKGAGTLAYRDGWNLFDQVIMTNSLIAENKDYSSYKAYKTDIFSPSYLITPEGQYKGYPFRMFGGDTYRANGFSDHFPVYTILLREL